VNRLPTRRRSFGSRGSCRPTGNRRFDHERRVLAKPASTSKCPSGHVDLRSAANKLRIERRLSSLVCLLNRWRWVQSTRGSSCESVTRRCAKAWRGSSRLQRSEAIGARSELSKQGLCPRAYRCCRSRSTTSCPKKPAVSKEHAGQRGLARTLRGHARIGARSAAHQVGKTWEIARPSLTTAVHSGVYRSARFDRGKALWTAHALLLSRGAKHVVVLAKPEHSPSGNRGERRR